MQPHPSTQRHTPHAEDGMRFILFKKEKDMQTETKANRSRKVYMQHAVEWTQSLKTKHRGSITQADVPSVVMKDTIVRDTV